MFTSDNKYGNLIYTVFFFQIIKNFNKIYQTYKDNK